MVVTAQSGLIVKPDNIFRTSLLARYPDAAEEQWSENYDGKSVSFKSGGAYIEALFNEKGQWMCTFNPIEFEALPQAARDSLTGGTYKSWQKGSAYYVEAPGIKAYYKIFVYSFDWYELELNFDITGKENLTNLP